MSYLLDNWGSFVSLLGLFATVFGLIVVFRRAPHHDKNSRSRASLAILSIRVKSAFEVLVRAGVPHRQEKSSRGKVPDLGPHRGHACDVIESQRQYRDSAVAEVEVGP